MGDLLVDLSLVMVMAGVAAVLCQRLRQPPALGYILAGVVIGPYWDHPLPRVTDLTHIHALFQIGAVLLMLGLGLQFSFTRLKKILPSAMVAAGLEVVLMVYIGYQAGQAFGWSKPQSLLLGAMLISSSTMIVTSMLRELDLTREKFAQMLQGVLLLDDIYAVLAIVLITGLAAGETLSTTAALQIAQNMGIFLTVIAVVGLLILPHLLRYVANLKNDQALLITVMALGFGFSLLSLQLGYTAALGAFVIGAIMAQARSAGRINQLVEPVRDTFTSVFFITAGMFLDPVTVHDNWHRILVLTAVVIMGKLVTGALGSLTAGYDLRASVRVGAGLGQIGEFSFIMAVLGMQIGVVTPSMMGIIIAVCWLSTLLTPPLLKQSDALVNGIQILTPQPLLDMLEVYRRWYHRGSANPMYAPVKKLVRKTLLQILLNLALLAAIFIGAAYLNTYTHRQDLWPKQPGWEIVRDSVFWLLAMGLSLPLIAATFRKLRAMAMLLAEISIVPTAAGQNTQLLRAMFTSTIVAGGMIGLAFLILMLSSALLPPWPVLAMLLIGLALLARYWWNAFIQLYAAAQAEIGQTLFAQDVLPIETDEGPPAKALPPLLYAAELEMVHIDDHSCLVSKFLRETEIRTQTGASVVGIERQGENIVNPSPDEEVLAGDNLLLLGTRAQLAAARKLVSPDDAGEASPTAEL